MTQPNTEVETGFYTLNCNDSNCACFGDPITYCAQHALRYTNEGMAQIGMAPSATMAEALVVCQLQMILNEDPQAETLITYSEHGKCDECGKEA